MQHRLWQFLIIPVCFGMLGCSTYSPTTSVRLNQIQVIGSHNSYHLRAHESLRMLLATRSTETVKGLNYTHPPLPEQLSRLGVRQIELDCFADPEGGLYAHPKGLQWAASTGLPPVPNQDPEGKLCRPGFKVLHVPDIDSFSSYSVRFEDGIVARINPVTGNPGLQGVDLEDR